MACFHEYTEKATNNKKVPIAGLPIPPLHHTSPGIECDVIFRRIAVFHRLAILPGMNVDYTVLMKRSRIGSSWPEFLNWTLDLGVTPHSQSAGLATNHRIHQYIFRYIKVIGGYLGLNSLELELFLNYTLDLGGYDSKGLSYLIVSISI